ncbi:hypothetical protein Pelo_10656 [Pelomyxa schiedti]|nr:hypothetical protein Pelo_10656 [Pelomyxa schiedti]
MHVSGVVVAVLSLIAAARSAEWKLVTNNLGYYGDAVSFSDAAHGLLIGGESLWVTNNSGIDFYKVGFDHAPVTRFLDSAATTTSMVACGAGDSSYFVGCVYSTDLGTTWTTTDESYIHCEWRDVKRYGTSFVKTGDWTDLVRSGSGISYSEDGGKSWTNRAWIDGVSAWYSSFTSNLFGWTVGGNSDLFNASLNRAVLCKTTNGGLGWTTLKDVSGGQTYAGIDFVDNMHGWTISNIPSTDTSDAYGMIEATTNGGSAWSVQFKVTGVTLKSIYMVSSTEGWVVGGYEDGLVYRSLFYYTTDGGATWTSYELRGYIVNNVDGFDAKHVYASAESETNGASVLQWFA